MTTHTDNRQHGTIIKDSAFQIETINQVDGINPSSIISYLPVVHDISDQCNGTTRTFTLNPPMALGTQNLFIVFLNGQQIQRANAAGDPDFFITSAGQQIVLGDGITPPPIGATLVAVYVEDDSLIP